MDKICKKNILNFVPHNFETETTINPNRIKEINSIPIKNDGFIIYLCEREIRLKDNFALQFALRKSKELNLPLRIIHPKISYIHKQKNDFINKQIQLTEQSFLKHNLDFQIIENENLPKYLEKTSISILIIDFNPILKRNWLKEVRFKVFEIDGHNIIPARFVSCKQEYSAMTLRRKIYANIYPFLTEYSNIFSVHSEADLVLKNFIENKLSQYSELRNIPTQNNTSELSKYLNLGFISSQRVALEIIKSGVNDVNKEAFLEELIVRKELADNFCLYCKSFKTLKCIPSWAKESLKEHITDIRPYIYSLKDLENANTHDILWNATQIQLVKEGKIESYLRMYWAKKILEWSYTPQDAVKSAIFLNDKYAFDAPSANGYVGILWAIGGLHDRAFQDWYITGKIRRMTFSSTMHKFNINEYIEKYTKS